MCLSQPIELVLALHERELGSQLHVHHHGDAAVQLKEGRRFFPGQYLAKYRHIFLAKLRCGDVHVQPSANEIVCLLIGLRSVLLGILFDQRGSGVVDLCKIRRILLIHRPELSGFAIRERQIRSDDLLLDGTDVLEQQRELLVRKSFGTPGDRGCRLRRWILSDGFWASKSTYASKCEHSKY